MSIPLEEHDYIGLTEVPPSKDSCVSSMESNKVLNLKATELRLGLPGSESPERDNSNSLVVLKSFVSGAKRGYSDTMNGAGSGSGNWVFSAGSEVLDSAKSSGLFSPRSSVNGGSKILGAVVVSENNTSNNLQQSSIMGANAVKDSAPKSPRPAAQEKKPSGHGVAPAAKAQVVGWPPIRSFRKNSMASNPPKTEEDVDGKLGAGCLYVKVSMDGAPYLRKVDLKIYKSYNDLSSALEKMFSCFTLGQCGKGIPIRDGLTESRLMDLLHGSEYVLTYEDKDGDWMLVGDVPWESYFSKVLLCRISTSMDVHRILQEDEDHEEFRCNWSSSKSHGEVQKPLDKQPSRCKCSSY